MIEITLAAEVFASLAHEFRLRALRLLVRAGPDGLPAGQLAAQLGLGATAASFHLNKMRQAGLVQRRRDGARLLYSANFERVRMLRDFLDAECCVDAASDCGPNCAGSGATGHHAGSADADVPAKQEV